MTANREPIVVTGIGVCSPLGRTADELMGSLLAGRSAVKPVTAFDVSGHPCRFAAGLDAIPCPPGLDPVSFARLTRVEQLARYCLRRAAIDADLPGDRPERLGVILGTSAEHNLAWEWASHADNEKGPNCTPESDRRPLLDSALADLGMTGPRATVSAACASGNFALDQACSWLRAGYVDACMAGACDAAVSPITLACFGNLRALSRRNDAPHAASRPFDRDRDGFVLGEGGAVLVLERRSDAVRRGARILGEVAGCGLTSDAHHPVIPCPDPAHAVRAMREALAEAKVSPAEVDYLNAHGTSTPVGDVAEARALREAFGTAIDRVPVSSVKSMTGHLLTAASALEAVVCLMAIREGALPPTINLDDPDPECRLNHVAKTAQRRRVRVAASNSFGFGGSNSCVVFKAA